MKTKINVFLVGNPLQSLKQYKQELDHLGDHPFSFCVNGTFSLTDLNSFPDILFINCGRDDLFGLNVLKKIKRLNPETQVILAVSDQDTLIGRHGMKRGALAYLIKGGQELQQVRSIMAICKALVAKPRPEQTLKLGLPPVFFKSSWLPLRRFFHF